MVQVENEYGSYGEDKPYISAIRDIIRQSGFDKVALFQCDWSSNFTKNGLDDLIWTMNFGTGANIDNEFRKLGQLRPNSPKMCSEFWSGWFDKWGGRHETRGSKEMVSGLKEMLDKAEITKDLDTEIATKLEDEKGNILHSFGSEEAAKQYLRMREVGSIEDYIKTHNSSII